ncbi:amidohydrolase 1 [Tanacetum coccineum]
MGNGTSSHYLRLIRSSNDLSDTDMGRVILEFIHDGDKSVAELMDIGRHLLRRRQVLPTVPHLIDSVQVEGTFPDGTKLIPVHNPISSENGNLELALHGSFLPTRLEAPTPLLSSVRLTICYPHGTHMIFAQNFDSINDQQAAMDCNIKTFYGLNKKVASVKNVRKLTKLDMKLNDALPHIEVDPETYAVTADGECKQLIFDTVELNTRLLDLPGDMFLRYIRLIKSKWIRAKLRFAIKFNQADIPRTHERASADIQFDMLKRLRFKYATKILLKELNLHAREDVRIG